MWRIFFFVFTLKELFSHRQRGYIISEFFFYLFNFKFNAGNTSCFISFWSISKFNSFGLIFLICFFPCFLCFLSLIASIDCYYSFFLAWQFLIHYFLIYLPFWLIFLLVWFQKYIIFLIYIFIYIYHFLFIT